MLPRTLPARVDESAAQLTARVGLGRGAVVGPAIVVLGHGTAAVFGANFDATPRESFWQFIPSAELSADPVRSLWYFHAQPPAVNLVFVATDRLGELSTTFLRLLLLAVAIALVLLVGDTVAAWSRSRAAAIGASAVAALVPATTFYALWLYPTLTVALLVTLTVWGLARGQTDGRRLPLIASAAGITGLFLMRATVAWPVALAWLGLVVWVALKQRDGRSGWRPVALAAGVCVALIGVFTIKNIILFGSPTQSSWAKENYANVVLNVLTPQEEAEVAATDPCLAELVQVGTFKPLDRYPVCLAGVGPIGPSIVTPVLDESRWQNGRVNYNHRQRLVLSARWGELVAVSLGTFPSVIVRVLHPLQVNGHHDWGSPVLLLGPSTRYIFVKENVGRLGSVGMLWAAAFAWVPSLALLSWLSGIALVLSGMRRLGEACHSYVTTSVFVGALTVAYLLLEFGENQRFQVELLYAWIALGATAVRWLVIDVRGIRPDAPALRQD